jgi:hypothetical protein
VIQICSTCKRNYGEKEPFEDRRETHGYCKGCFATEKFKIAAEIALKVFLAEPSILLRLALLKKFFGVCVNVWEKNNPFCPAPSVETPSKVAPTSGEQVSV